MLALSVKVKHIINVFLWMGINYPFSLQDLCNVLMVSSYKKYCYIAMQLNQAIIKKEELYFFFFFKLWLYSLP